MSLSFTFWAAPDDANQHQPVQPDKSKSRARRFIALLVPPKVQMPLWFI